jgi:ATP-dependent RNA helicase DDX23/PRP28
VDRDALEREAEDIRLQNGYAHSERERERGRYGRRDPRGDRDKRPPQDDRRAPRVGYQNVPTGPRADRAKAPPTGPAAASTPPSTSSPALPSSMPPPPLPYSTLTAPGPKATLPEPSSPFVPPMTDNDLSAIRSRYLGVDKKKRKIRKMNDRKFVFDWDAQDDTFAEDSPVAVGSNRQGAQVMFGRGRLAGMDDGGGSGPRRIPGETEKNPQLADAIERRKAAKSGFDERHWSEKPLEEMKERDWRIFREDFSISARGLACFYLSVTSFIYLLFLGGQIPHPLRSWAESIIPESILEVIDKIGYKEPSPIQRQAIPIGLQNRDIIGIAETGGS